MEGHLPSLINPSRVRHTHTHIGQRVVAGARVGTENCYGMRGLKADTRAHLNTS